MHEIEYTMQMMIYYDDYFICERKRVHVVVIVVVIAVDDNDNHDHDNRHDLMHLWC